MTPLRLLGSTALALALALPTLPALSAASTVGNGFTTFQPDGGDTLVIDVKQGRSGTGVRGRDRDDDDDDDDDRGRGRGSDDSHDDDRGGRDDDGGFNGGINGGYDDSGSGRDKPRIPGGSGCDDPEDLIEHPECRVGLTIIGQ